MKRVLIFLEVLLLFERQLTGRYDSKLMGKIGLNYLYK